MPSKRKRSAVKRRASRSMVGKERSRYARKKKWLAGTGLFGFQVPEPKPWR